jgi:hypothetical protein
MLKAQRAVRAALRMKLSSGYHMCITNVTPFTSRMNMEKTEMTTLKLVGLAHLSACGVEQAPIYPDSQR